MTPDSLAVLHAACFTTPRPWSTSEFEAILASRGAFLETSTNGALVGRVIAGEAELLTVAVYPEARGKGEGRALVAAFLDRAAAMGAETAFIEVAADNTAALYLYLCAGFSESGRRAGYYKAPNGQSLDAVVMSRIL